MISLKGRKAERMRSQNSTESARREKCKGEKSESFHYILDSGPIKDAEYERKLSL